MKKSRFTDSQIMAARHTFLLDPDTGKTWLVVTGKKKKADGTETEYCAWQPFAE